MPEFEPRYPPARWRLIVDTAMRTGAENMALDEAIMEAVAAGDSPPTLRFYQWAPPCLSLGKRQPLDGVDLAACRADGVDVVRRATGGWAILHTDELTYSVALRPDDPRVSGAILDTYRTLSQGLIAGLRLLGRRRRDESRHTRWRAEHQRGLLRGSLGLRDHRSAGAN